MLILIIGGSGSGKSAYAEQCAQRYAAAERHKYYLATMAVRDEEMQRKVERHHRMRQGAGWITLEYPVDVGRAAGQVRGDSVVLLEDLGNLAANEIFRPEGMRSAEETCRRIADDIALLESACSVLIIVSNAVFDDGEEYDAGTMEYIRALGLLHQSLAARAQAVTEVVFGMPSVIKGRQGEDADNPM